MMNYITPYQMADLLTSEAIASRSPAVEAAATALGRAERESFDAAEWSATLHNQRLAPYRAALQAALEAQGR